MSLQSIFLRIFLSMLIGALIGGERESIHRPAGLRTHMLVSIGAAVVMMLGLFLSPTHPNADPARLGAQVISGIGFLGAGTILKEGLTIKGLTTAASLWSVACMGLAVGAGFYALSLLGTLVILLTLTVFERVQGHVFKSRYLHFLLELSCTETADILSTLDAYAASHHLLICGYTIQKQTSQYLLSCHIKSQNPHQAIDQQTLLVQLSAAPSVRHLTLTPL